MKPEDINKNILAIRIKNAERRLLLSTEHYERQAAQAELNRLLDHAQQMKGD
jgi:hypothetical protein